jgi:hypothetical protein
MQTIRMHLLAPHPTDATSFYRSYGPIAHMRRHYPLEVVDSPTVAWPNVSLSDIVFLQRPFNNQHVEIAEWAKSTGCKLLIDYDDLLFNLPPENKAYFNYLDENIRRNITKLLNIADHITVSTDFIKQDLQTRTKRPITTIENALPPQFINREFKEERTKMFLWRGSDTHCMDIMHLEQPLTELMKEYKDWMFIYMGFVPPMKEASKLPNFKPLCGLQVHEYFRAIHKAAPLIMYHPLRDHPFNHAKSNCCWMEATFAGALFVGPDTHEFSKHKGMRNYKIEDAGSFYNTMSQAITDASNGNIEDVITSNDIIRDSLTLDQTNKVRFNIIHNLIRGKDYETNE